MRIAFVTSVGGTTVKLRLENDAIPKCETL